MRCLMVLLVVLPILANAAPFKKGWKGGMKLIHKKGKGKNPTYSAAYIKANFEEQLKRFKELNEDNEGTENPYGREIPMNINKPAFTEIEETNSRPGNEDLLEGDIKVEHTKHDVTRRAATSNPYRLWPNGIVPFIFDSGYSMSYQLLVSAAMGEIAQHTCIRFVPSTNPNEHKIRIIAGSGCWSYIGKITSTTQDVSVPNGCLSRGTIIHELMHALGFYHEQSRPDRDTYVTIVTSNINSSRIRNFDKQSNASTFMFGTYDYGSVMHYSWNAFAIDRTKATIIPKSSTSVTLGQRVGLASSDSAGINSLYQHECSKTTISIDGRWADWSNFGPCSVTCGDGVRERTRTCTSPPPSLTGQPCSGISTQSETCNMGSCGSGSSGDVICNFDSGMCDWTSSASTLSGSTNTLTWTRRSGSTPSWRTGPNRDHTTGTGHYVYVETSSPAKNYHHAVMTSPLLSAKPSGSRRCLTYHIHRYGSAMGNTDFYLQNTDGTMTLLRRHSGASGNRWVYDEIEFDASIESRIVIRGFKGFSWSGDMALDDVHINNGKCEMSPLICGFETSSCQWTPSAATRYKILTRSGSTPSRNTGPFLAKEGSDYIYAEASSPATSGDVATLTSPLLTVSSGSSCLRYNYHMYGASVGTLRVLTISDNGVKKTQLKLYSGNKGNYWLEDAVTIDRSKETKVQFEFTRGWSWDSDIALDDVRFDDSPCS